MSLRPVHYAADRTSSRSVQFGAELVLAEVTCQKWNRKHSSSNHSNWRRLFRRFRNRNVFTGHGKFVKTFQICNINTENLPLNTCRTQTRDCLVKHELIVTFIILHGTGTRLKIVIIDFYFKQYNLLCYILLWMFC